MDAMFFDRKNASKYYCRRANYRVQTLKTTAFIDTELQVVLDVHWTIERRHDTQLGWQPARLNAGEFMLSIGSKLRYDLFAGRLVSSQRASSS